MAVASLNAMRATGIANAFCWRARASGKRSSTPEGEREQVVARESGRRYVDASRSRRGYQRTVSSKCAGCFPSQRTRHVYVPFGNGL